MTRVTAPMSKLARSLGSNPSVARPNYISGASKAGAALTRSSELSGEGRSSDNDSSRRSMTTAHRPMTVQPNPNRTIPLMQGFHSTAPPAARLDTSSIDFAVLPPFDLGAGASDPGGVATMMMRVPLLPDNFAPDRSAFAPESFDPPLPAPEISVIAAHPDKVLAALTEVEGMGVDGVELGFMHDPAPPLSATTAAHEPGMIRDVWKGLVDDVFGGSKPAAL